jgi:predicted ATP-grasp superfamily ATP-dependent carboligase
MGPTSHLILLGASVRAAAFSALRAGLRPWCADLFADADLRAISPVVAVPAADYPDGLVELARQGPPGPWMYTGALENRPDIVRKIRSERAALWGNNSAVLQQARSPLVIDSLFACAKITRPDVRLEAASVPTDGSWLVKPLRGAGGSGIQVWKGQVRGQPRLRGVYFQQFVEGEPHAAVFVAVGRRACLLGVTRQLIGESWLHAEPFHYCGSIGCLAPLPAHRQALDRLGNALVEGCGLRGLFGVDYVLKDGIPWPVEINPRYTASVEVLEHSLGTPALALHHQAFAPDRAGPIPTIPPSARPPIGKAILFARALLDFPAEGPWIATFRKPPDPWELPAFADIPVAGQHIEAGQPILTFFARGDTALACRDTLRQVAADLDLWLYG